MKSDSRIERMHRLRNRVNRAEHTVGLLLALVCVITVSGQTLVPAARTSTAADPPGDLNARRSGHTATLLTTDKVVVVGGDTDFLLPEFLDTELFDLETGTWSVTGSLHSPRFEHTATLLRDGRVLIAAGARKPPHHLLLSSAELNDPGTGKWSATGNLIATRIAHTATLLPDGKVLVAGGFTTLSDQNNRILVLGSAELYDPDTGLWRETGKLNTPRSQHTATLLQNGKVLVVGGSGDRAELYDPNTGTWSLTGNLNTRRWNHAATKLQNGKILVAGGQDSGDLTGDFALIDSAELYDPDTETWSKTGNLNTPRADPATLLPNGKVLVAGGSTAELYDPETGTWSRTAGLNAPRISHTATLLPDGRVLVAGGSSSINLVDWRLILNSSELYDPDTETWTGPVVPVITGTSIVGKKLVLFGENFGPDAVILRNGIELQTKKTGDTRKLVAKKKAGKTIKPGDRLQVLNRSGALSKEFVFTGP